MIGVLRIIITLAVLAVAVNHGVEAGSNHNPGWGVVWGILFFVFWWFVCQLTLTILVVLREKLNNMMDDHPYPW